VSAVAETSPIYDEDGGYVWLAPIKDWEYLERPLAFLRSIYPDGVEQVAVTADVDKRGGEPLLTALVRIQTGDGYDYVAIRWSSWHSPTIYEATCGWIGRKGGWEQRSYEPSDAGRGPDDLFVWGQIIDVHRVNGYEVIEFVREPADNRPDEQPEVAFHISQVDGKRLSHGAPCLDSALMQCMYVRAAIRDGRDYLNGAFAAVAFARRGMRLDDD
jgi:hypothetical protein